VHQPKHNNKMKTLEAQTFPDLDSRSEFGDSPGAIQLGEK